MILSEEGSQVMRAGTLIAIVALALVAIGAFYFVDIDQTQEGRAPDVDVSVEDPGQLPEYDVETGDIDVNTQEKTVTVPDVDVTTEEKTITVPDVDVTPAPAN
jgi:hypothetical protein